MPSGLGETTYFKLLLQHEEAVARLYQTLGAKCPGRQKFWQEMAAAEEVHITWLREMADALAAGSLHLGEGRFSLEDIRESLDFITTNNHLAANKPEMSGDEAFQIACRVENTMIEKAFFIAMTGDSPKIRERLTWIQTQTEEHRSRLNQGCKHHGKWSWLSRWFQ